MSNDFPSYEDAVKHASDLLQSGTFAADEFSFKYSCCVMLEFIYGRSPAETVKSFQSIAADVKVARLMARRKKYQAENEERRSANENRRKAEACAGY